MISEYLRYRRERKRTGRLMQIRSSELTRDFILDSRLLEAQQLSALLGLPEITSEAVDQSEERSRRVSHLLPLVSYFASALTTGVMAYYDTVSPWKDELSEEEKIAMQIWISKVSVSCTLGSLSQLDALDLIEVKK